MGQTYTTRTVRVLVADDDVPVEYQCREELALLHNRLNQIEMKIDAIMNAIEQKPPDPAVMEMWRAYQPIITGPLETAGVPVLGDVDNDGDVDVRDVAEMLP